MTFRASAYNYFHHEDAPDLGENIIEVSTNVSAENGQVSEAATFGNEEVSAQVPAGVQVESNTLTLTVTEKANSDSGVALEEGQEILPLDIHIDGVSAENTTAIQVFLGKIPSQGMNIGTVKNLTIKNFSSDGEITTTGAIAAYADCGAAFENIAIFNCNPKVYNIGNGGSVGCVGWYTMDETDKPVTFTNITVDNTNKISALWGSCDVACGGIVGQYYPTSGQTSVGSPKNAGIALNNCHVAAQMDVYNDVCANYQYYAYRYAGILIGSVHENVTENGHSYPNMDGIEAKGCTVHFGDWNDYYYCELVANSLEFYTHDHQFSRLDQVKSVDVENMQVTSLKGETIAIPTSGRSNYVVVTGEHATDHAPATTS